MNKLRIVFEATPEVQALCKSKYILVTDNEQILPWFSLLSFPSEHIIPVRKHYQPKDLPVNGCVHDFETFEKQDRAGDEAFSAYKQCKKCKFVTKSK